MQNKGKPWIKSWQVSLFFSLSGTIIYFTAFPSPVIKGSKPPCLYRVWGGAAVLNSLGFAGGRSFGLSLAASGYLVACLIGVLALNFLARKGKIERKRHEELSGSVTIDLFQSQEEIPLGESLDRLSMQISMIILTYLLAFLFTWGITSLITAISPGAGKTVNSLLWGFNFIIGSLMAVLVKVFLSKMKRLRFMEYQYQNNYKKRA